MQNQSSCANPPEPRTLYQEKMPSWCIYLWRLAPIMSLLLAAAFLNQYENWGDDWAQYLLQAQAIVHGNVSTCIAENRFMMRESGRPLGPVAYPWGFPALLAIEGRLASFDLRTFKFFNVVLFVVTVLLVRKLAAIYLDERQALAAALMCAFNPLLIQYCNHILSEIPFTLASIAALWAAGMSYRSASRPVGW